MSRKKRFRLPRHSICVASYTEDDQALFADAFRHEALKRGAEFIDNTEKDYAVCRVTVSVVDLQTDREVDFVEFWEHQHDQDEILAAVDRLHGKYRDALVFNLSEAVPLVACERCDCGGFTHRFMKRGDVLKALRRS